MSAKRSSDSKPRKAVGARSLDQGAVQQRIGTDKVPLKRTEGALPLNSVFCRLACVKKFGLRHRSPHRVTRILGGSLVHRFSLGAADLWLHSSIQPSSSSRRHRSGVAVGSSRVVAPPVACAGSSPLSAPRRSQGHPRSVPGVAGSAGCSQPHHGETKGTASNWLSSQSGVS